MIFILYVLNVSHINIKLICHIVIGMPPGMPMGRGGPMGPPGMRGPPPPGMMRGGMYVICATVNMN